MIGEMAFRQAEGDRRLAGLIYSGLIVAVDAAAGRVKVDCGDGLVSDWVPWQAGRLGAVVVWSPPSVGETACLLCESGELSEGIAFPGVTHSPPAGATADEHFIRFSDGGAVRYNPTTGAMVLKALTSLTIDTPTVALTGNLITPTGDVVASGKSLRLHTHPETGSVTGPPN